jgi:hypothetical protein
MNTRSDGRAADRRKNDPPTPEELARATAQALRAAGTLPRERRAVVGRLLVACADLLLAMEPSGDAGKEG